MLFEDSSSNESMEKLVNVICCAAGNTRICIADEEDMLLREDFFNDDEDSNDQYLSREAIKNLVRQCAEQQAMTNKKRRSKKA